MIKGFDKYSMFDTMRDSEFEFFLTGSRYFGTDNSGSDYDFFVQDCPEIHNWLIKNSFRAILNARYGRDSLTVVVYRYRDIDVQVVKNAGLKNVAQIGIKKVTLCPTPEYWELAYSLLSPFVK